MKTFTLDANIIDLEGARDADMICFVPTDRLYRRGRSWFPDFRILGSVPERWKPERRFMA